MTEQPKHIPIDFDNMPQTVEQQTLAVLLRIEVLLTPAKPIETPEEHKSKIAALQDRVPAAPRKGFGRK